MTYPATRNALPFRRGAPELWPFARRRQEVCSFPEGAL